MNDQERAYHEARRSVRKYAKAEISKGEMAKIVEEALNARHRGLEGDVM